MRRILLVISLLIILPVKAETYYSDYSNYSNWSLDPVVSSDITDVEIERRYLYYHESIEGDYYIEGENPSDYPYVDKTNTMTEVREYEEEYVIKPNQIVEPVKLYYYKIIMPIRYIVISNIHGSNGRLSFSEGKVLARDTDLDLYTECSTCSSDFQSKFHNENYTDNNYISNGDTLYIDLNAGLTIDEVLFYLYVRDDESGDMSFTVSFRYEKDGPDYVRGYFHEYRDYSMFLITMDFMDLVDPLWSEEKVTEYVVTPTKNRGVRVVDAYRVTNTYYYYYKIIKDYSQVHNDYYNKYDENTYEDYYRYRTRDKVVIADEIIIDNKQKIEDYILDSTVEVRVEPELDYSKNGTYNVNFITPFKTINKDVIIDRYENKYNDLNNTVDGYLDEIDRLNKELDNSNNNLDNYIKELNNYMTKLEDTSKELEKYKNKDELESYNKYIEELNTYIIEIEKLNSEINDYKQDIEVNKEENNRIKREYENEIINLRMSGNDNECIEEVVKKSECYYIPFIILWLLVIIMLIILLIWHYRLKRKSSFVETV